jgi:hypothetical protein
MGTVTEDTSRESWRDSEFDGICHIVEPDDPDTALCGKDVTGYPWNPPWPICVVCADLAGWLAGSA